MKNRIKQIHYFCMLWLGLLGFTPALVVAGEEPSSSMPAMSAEQLNALEERMRELESELVRLRQQVRDQQTQLQQVDEQQSAAMSPAPAEHTHSTEEFWWNDLVLGFGITTVGQGTGDANKDDARPNDPENQVFDASYSIDFTVEKTFADIHTGFFRIETGDSEGVENNLQVYSNVNRDAADEDNSLVLTEAWYQHQFRSIPLAMQFGKIDPTIYLDTNRFANDEAVFFLGRMFRNSPVLAFPDDNTAGVRLIMQPNDLFSLELIAADANGDFDSSFSTPFYSGQINFTPNFLGREGNYRVYGWANEKEEFTDWESGEEDKRNYGFGLSFDQDVTDMVGLFARYGWQNPEVYNDEEEFSLAWSWSIGTIINGALWQRSEDFIGLAVGQVAASDDYKREANRVFESEREGDLNANTETHFEAFYSFKVTNSFTLSPDIQIITEPYGGDAVRDDLIFVGGIRSQIDF